VLGHSEPARAGRHLSAAEAQLDRFLLQIDVSYPDQGAERRMLFATTGTDERRVETDPDRPGTDGHHAWCAVARPRQGVEAILKLARSARLERVPVPTRPPDRLGPRSARQPGPDVGLRAKALIDGRWRRRSMT